MSSKAMSLKGRIIQQLSLNDGLQREWDKYQKRFSYANGIRFQSVIEVLTKILEF